MPFRLTAARALPLALALCGLAFAAAFLLGRGASAGDPPRAPALPAASRSATGLAPLRDPAPLPRLRERRARKRPHASRGGQRAKPPPAAAPVAPAEPVLAAARKATAAPARTAPRARAPVQAYTPSSAPSTPAPSAPAPSTPAPQAAPVTPVAPRPAPQPAPVAPRPAPAPAPSFDDSG
jgi:hypothetical protein